MKARVPAPGSSGASRVRFARNSRCALFSWLTFPQVKARRNEPSVDGARTPPNSLSIAPCRSRPMSSIEVGARGHAGRQAGDLQARVRAAVAAGADVRGGQVVQPGALGEGGQRDQAGVRDQVRVVERRARFRERMQQSHLRGVLSGGYVEASDTPLSQFRGHLSYYFRRKYGEFAGWIQA